MRLLADDRAFSAALLAMPAYTSLAATRRTRGLRCGAAPDAGRQTGLRWQLPVPRPRRYCSLCAGAAAAAAGRAPACPERPQRTHCARIFLCLRLPALGAESPACAQRPCGLQRCRVRAAHSTLALAPRGLADVLWGLLICWQRVPKVPAVVDFSRPLAKQQVAALVPGHVQIVGCPVAVGRLKQLVVAKVGERLTALQRAVLAVNTGIESVSDSGLISGSGPRTSFLAQDRAAAAVPCSDTWASAPSSFWIWLPLQACSALRMVAAAGPTTGCHPRADWQSTCLRSRHKTRQRRCSAAAFVLLELDAVRKCLALSLSLTPIRLRLGRTAARTPAPQPPTSADPALPSERRSCLARLFGCGCGGICFSGVAALWPGSALLPLVNVQCGVQGRLVVVQHLPRHLGVLFPPRAGLSGCAHIADVLLDGAMIASVPRWHGLPRLSPPPAPPSPSPSPSAMAKCGSNEPLQSWLHERRSAAQTAAGPGTPVQL
ncbi:hypothetical protein BX661DRAFT_66523 [Kickxella alabastrina]|uniref:uncharacterized protein n=1 Tax=Kickxella alabastrina TaxID=61397 RepID=UPI00221F5B3B|nr:uncharacterized protein BX661DRAFT_66523 [Kickxella alabastrina]KAI7833891.1 hypothetical protein BX661DRAFT_66523 [Kickxella alabastrina]